MPAWHQTAAARRLGVTYPIVQGPFGGGHSSAELTAAVSNLGGLGSFGARGLAPQDIGSVVADIRRRTSAPFAINLWMSLEDDGAAAVTREEFEHALAPLLPLYREFGVTPPVFAGPQSPDVAAQIQAVIDARVPVFSFIFGIPDAAVLDECRRHGIITVGAATSVDEAVALEAAGVDAIVASGFEAGGHRPSFLDSADASLTGLFGLVPQVVDAVRLPVIAAGGIADGRTVAAALMLGASGVQVGTAFLACEESNVAPAHRAALFGPERKQSVLTRGFSGRLARGLRNRLSDYVNALPATLPYPLPIRLIDPLVRAGRTGERSEIMPLFAGQNAALVRHRRAADVFAALLAETDALLQESHGVSS